MQDLVVEQDAAEHAPLGFEVLRRQAIAGRDGARRWDPVPMPLGLPLSRPGVGRAACLVPWSSVVKLGRWSIATRLSARSPWGGRATWPRVDQRHGRESHHST